MDFRTMMELGSINTTPDKTEVRSSRNSISVKNIGCKGTLRKREQCESCARRGTYQAGILAWRACCNREDGWRKLEGKTDRACKFYTKKDEDK